ncbi:MAG: DUF58 domain-containing protein [Geothermobacteraceae bacterium]
MTLLLGFGAVNTGNNLMYLLVSALLGFMAVSGLLGKANISRLELRPLPAPELYAGLQAPLPWLLVNRRRRLPAFLIELSTGQGRAIIPLLGPGQRQRVRLPHTFDRRGDQPLPAVTLSSHFPINFFVRHLRLPTAGETLVFPALIESRLPVTDDPVSSMPRQLLEQAGYEGDLRAIVDYSGAEPLRSLHWKLSARHEELKVKQTESLGGNPVMIDVADLPGHGEEQLGRACWLVNELERRQRPVGLRLGSQHLAVGSGQTHRLRLLGALARHDPS